jgi:flavorubredoxin
VKTNIDQIADDIYRLSTYRPGPDGRDGVTFNLFLINADEPLLYHCGQRWLFPLAREALGQIIDINRLRWLSCSHMEADECGAMNDWLTAAPNATVAHGALGCRLWVDDHAIRPPRVLKDGEVMNLGGKRVRFIATPHVPHNPDAGMLFEESTETLFCSDLFAQSGDCPALTEADVVGPAIAAEETFRLTSLTAQLVPTIRKLGALSPSVVATMHGSSFFGETQPLFDRLARYYEGQMLIALSGKH